MSDKSTMSYKSLKWRVRLDSLNFDVIGQIDRPEDQTDQEFEKAAMAALRRVFQPDVVIELQPIPDWRRGP